MKKKLISFVLPVYNEELVIPQLVEALNTTAKELINKYSVEFIFINDGSTDQSLSKLLDLRKKDNKIKIINLSRNFGQAMAFTAGIDYADGNAVILMDSDLQDPPSVALKFIKYWEKGYEVVYGKRKTRKDSIFKQLTAKYFYKIIHAIVEINIPADTGDFRLLDRKVILELRKFRERNRFIRGLVPYLGYKTKSVVYDRDKRFAGETKYNIRKMAKLALDGITSFSDFPIKMISRIAIFILSISLSAIIVQILFLVISNQEINWYLIGMSYITLLSGLIIFSISIIGTYISRIYSEVQNRPLYLVENFYD